ncbi:FMN-binding negative transcriptional regulator [Flavobacteriaceae bacterium F08102]|nr:FMN-binding negative transcriptional regulator [Flavobacteriaceae bacterium F08102]
MYIPSYYHNLNQAEIKQFLHANSFGILINQSGGKLLGTHIPMELVEEANGQQYLVGHISKANPQGASFGSTAEVLAIFSGPDAYVSSSWYDTEEVPTWNYIAVHVYGSIEVLDEQELLASLDTLVTKYEATMEQPISLDNLSAKTLDQVRGILGFKLKITDIQAAYKLSQTRTAKEKTQIISALEKCPNSKSIDIAKAMKNTRS